MAAPLTRHVPICVPLLQQTGLLSRLSTNTNSDSQKKKASKFAHCPPRVFSGIQPTGIPHLGNYVGAIKNWVQLQKKYDDVIFSIVDLHSITVPQDPAVLRENILDMTACLLACGIDPGKSILFQQSAVCQHAELNWILSSLCTLPRLNHLPQWREKSERMKDPSVGLFTYPILQTADIIVYKATEVPVGEDQRHHIELARDLAKAFNRTFQVMFPRPELLSSEVPRIKSLRHPENKMSKSEPNAKGRIDLTDSPDEIREKIKKAVTDVTAELTYDPEERPGVSNLIDIHSSLTGLLQEEICEENMLLSKSDYKAMLADIVIEQLAPIRENVLKLKGDRSHLQQVLESGNERAREIAEETMKEVKKAVGLS
ncbi:tryptophan--tRNA ligase, mitochondrial-like [Haliotis asinina]|uniref:tryptophan--tRNA ligase, mitochondrial-like n=1 Tax=Haliotis asinina TaxID=109174 RepID=UPI0035326484